MTPALDTAAPKAGFALVSDVGDVARALRNLSGVGIGGLIGRLSTQRAAARRVDVPLASGEVIAVQVAGQGRPVLMIHGLGGSHHDWDDAVESLAHRHTIHRFDLLGHGERAATQRRPSLNEMADDVAQVIDGLALQRPLLVGHSMGALVVMKYLQEHGESRIAGVCLIDQSPRITTDEHWQLGLFGSLTRSQLQHTLGRLRGDFVETVASELLAKLAPLKQAGSRDALAGRLARWAVARLARSCGVERLLAMLESLADADFRDVIASITVPTMVVLGGASHHYGGLPLGQYYRDTLPDGTVRLYRKAAHSPHRQEPDRFAADLASFAARRCA
ncbi:MAG TPA: alpha/beta hydrolase [Burkholderiaceae bacterium]|nr:alpha/beta hydrolase [Burkholderiaceae bacterium]